MSTPDVEEQIPVQTPNIEKHRLLRYALLIAAASYVILSSYYISDMRSSLASLAVAQKAAIANLQQRQAATEDDLKTSNDALSQQLGITERGLQAAYAGTTTELRQNQRSFERRMQDQQNQQNQAVDQVTFEVANVQTELSGAKTEIAATRTDLESTKVKLDRAVGDLTGQSSLIARTREDLEELRHRGDRNYYEFSLSKGERATQLSTIALQLKKADAKKGKFTLNVIADDRVIEKKDRGVAEPLQFYTGRNRQLYEVVVFTVDKNKVTGYLSTPKTPGLTASR
ncbi:MAG: hypothetical protein ACLPW4_11190 [Candidatus Sulfotelmatobacter sp.]